MKTLIKMGVAGALLALVSASPAQEANGTTYVRANVGTIFMQDVDLKSVSGLSLPSGAALATLSWDRGFRFDFAGGYYNPKGNWGVELETGFMSSTADQLSWSGGSTNVSAALGGNITAYQVPILVNGIYKFPLSEMFKPYVGGGLGGVLTMVDVPGGSYSDFTFAYQLMAGLSFEASESMELNLGYKFMGSLDHSFDGMKTGPALSHSIVAGFTVRF